MAMLEATMNYISCQESEYFSPYTIPQYAGKPKSNSHFYHPKQNIMIIASKYCNSAKWNHYNPPHIFNEVNTRTTRWGNLLVFPKFPTNLGKQKSNRDQQHYSLKQKPKPGLMQLGVVRVSRGALGKTSTNLMFIVSMKNHAEKR